MKCAECGKLLGYFEPARLPRFMASALRAMASQFAGGGDGDATGDKGAPLPLVCPEHRGAISG